jgi:hypothetical protein
VCFIFWAVCVLGFEIGVTSGLIFSEPEVVVNPHLAVQGVDLEVCLATGGSWGSGFNR